MKLLRMLAATFFLGTSFSIHAGTIINCSVACATCEKEQVCYCDPGNGYQCIEKDKMPLDLQIILEQETVQTM